MKPITTNRHFLLFAILTAGLLAGSISSSRGASMTFGINANGIKEVNSSGVPNGDPDGTAVGTIVLNDGTGGTTGFAVFNLTLANIELTSFPASGHHIHMAPPTTTGSVFLGFGDPDDIRPGAGNVLSGTVPNLSSSLIDQIMANPTAFYYNLHNGPFPGGAVRDQLVPEPSTICLGVLGAAMAAAWMRRRSQKRA